MLQDDVVRCIQEFRLAGIKVWMLTGDKGETAMEIGLLCGMYERESVEMLEVKDDQNARELARVLDNHR